MNSIHNPLRVDRIDRSVILNRFTLPLLLLLGGCEFYVEWPRNERSYIQSTTSTTTTWLWHLTQEEVNNWKHALEEKVEQAKQEWNFDSVNVHLNELIQLKMWLLTEEVQTIKKYREGNGEVIEDLHMTIRCSLGRCDTIYNKAK